MGSKINARLGSLREKELFLGLFEDLTEVTAKALEHTATVQSNSKYVLFLETMLEAYGATLASFFCSYAKADSCDKLVERLSVIIKENITELTENNLVSHVLN